MTSHLPFASQIEALLNDSQLVQVNGMDDSYYLGTCAQLESLCTALFDYSPKQCERKVLAAKPIEQEETKEAHMNSSAWVWVSDSDLCLRKTLCTVKSTHEVVANFQRVVHPVVRGIATKNPASGENINVVFEYVPKDWDAVFPDGSLLIGCANALTTGVEHYDFVVNCTSNLKAPPNSGVENYVQLLWLDSPQQDILSDLDEVLYKIHVWRTVMKKRVLVHCEMGISRSAACVMAYLLNYYNATYANVVQTKEALMKMRPIINPNRGFLQQLSHKFDPTPKPKNASRNGNAQ
jgi:protein-tyrosine phosphatase